MATTMKKMKKVMKKRKMKMKRKTAKKPPRRARGKKVMKKTVKKSTKAITAKRRMAIAGAAKKAKEKLIGKVVHFYDKIGVAIVDLKLPLSVGDTVTLKKGEWSAPQHVHSMQIEHLPVNKAKKGDVIGMKVDIAVREGTLVVPA